MAGRIGGGAQFNGPYYKSVSHHALFLGKLEFGLRIGFDYAVLVLHGPPHHPRFYGQLERQNREHRA